MDIVAKQNVYELHRAGYSIMVTKDETQGHPCWDVYYKKPNYPFTYAFGLPIKKGTTEDLKEVFNVALKCRPQHEYLFT